jgi:RNA polymerase sigma-70 factor (ECF subfamily)
MPLDDPTVISTIMHWRQKLTAAAWLVTHDRHAADDIFQTIVLKAITTGGTFEAEAAVVSWSFVTCRNASIDWLRRRKRETAVMEADTIARLHEEWATSGRQQEDRRAEALEECLGDVPEQARLLVRLRYTDGLACGDVAERLGINLDAVYKRLSRLHLTLRQCVEGKLATEGAVG